MIKFIRLTFLRIFSNSVWARILISDNNHNKSLIKFDYCMIITSNVEQKNEKHTVCQWDLLEHSLNWESETFLARCSFSLFLLDGHRKLRMTTLWLFFSFFFFNIIIIFRGLFFHYFNVLYGSQNFILCEFYLIWLIMLERYITSTLIL